MSILDLCDPTMDCENGITDFTCHTLLGLYEKTAPWTMEKADVRVFREKEICKSCPARTMAEKSLLFAFPRKSTGFLMVKNMTHFIQRLPWMFSQDTFFNTNSTQNGVFSETEWNYAISNANYVAVIFASSNPPQIEQFCPEEVGLFCSVLKSMMSYLRK